MRLRQLRRVIPEEVGADVGFTGIIVGHGGMHIISWEATVSASHWKQWKKQKTKNHSNRMSARHLKKRRKESRCPQDIHRARMLCGCFLDHAGQR